MRARVVILAAVAAILMHSTATLASLASELEPDQVATVKVEQEPGGLVPLDLVFRDENATPVRLGDYFNGRPVVLSLNYYRCQYLCPIEIDGIISGLNGISTLTLERDFELLTVSIDPREGPADAQLMRARGLRRYDRPQFANGWHALTGDPGAVEQLTLAVGFSYMYDAQADAFAHPAGVVVLTPNGQISRYLYGPEFSANDLRLALVDAGAGRTGSVVDRALLICYLYDPLTGRYTPLAFGLVRAGGVLGVIALVVVLGWLWRTDVRPFRKG
jgi:protein SCO1/2